jgi:hypothetical protein
LRQPLTGVSPRRSWRMSTVGNTTARRSPVQGVMGCCQPARASVVPPTLLWGRGSLSGAISIVGRVASAAIPSTKRWVWGEGCKQLDMHKAAANLGTELPYDPRSRSQVEPCDFCVRRGMFSRLGVQDGQKCPLKDSNVVAIMLTTPCRVSGDHPSLTLFAKILLPLVSLTLYVGWNTVLFAGKYPMFTYSP